MSETVDSIVYEPQPRRTAQTRHVAQILVEQLPALQGSGALSSDIAAGYRHAANRIDAWLTHGSWPRLRDDRS